MTQEYILINDIPAKLYRAQSPRGTVIAVHGFGGSKESYAIKSLAERVTANGLCVLTFDLPLHGERGGDCSALAIDRLIGEITAAEQYALDNIGGELYAFATSFGGMSMLHRTEQKSDPYKRIVLRVPAVNMADTLVTISAMSNPDFTLEKAKEQGFRFKMSREYIVPFQFYEGLKKLSCLRESEKWNDSRIMTIYAEKDELVKPVDTLEFLRLNPDIQSLCIKNSGHRMADSPLYLADALDSAARFILE